MLYERKSQRISMRWSGNHYFTIQLQASTRLLMCYNLLRGEKSHVVSSVHWAHGEEVVRALDGHEALISATNCGYIWLSCLTFQGSALWTAFKAATNCGHIWLSCLSFEDCALCTWGVKAATNCGRIWLSCLTFQGSTLCTKAATKSLPIADTSDCHALHFKVYVEHCVHEPLEAATNCGHVWLSCLIHFIITWFYWYVDPIPILKIHPIKTGVDCHSG